MNLCQKCVLASVFTFFFQMIFAQPAPPAGGSGGPGGPSGPGGPGGPGANVKHVFWLNSNRETPRSNDEGLDGVRSKLQLGPGVQFQVEYIDMPSPDNPNYYQNFAAAIQGRYGFTKWDVVILSGESAARFMENYGAQIFKGAVVVFSVPEGWKPKGPRLGPNWTGFYEKIDVPKNIEIIRTLQPDLQTLYYVADQSASSQFLIDQLNWAVQQLETPLQVLPLKGRSPDEMFAFAHSLSGSAAILNLGFNPPQRFSLNPDVFMIQLCQASSLPVYGLWNWGMGDGLVGGNLVERFDQGQILGDIANRILKGESPRSTGISTQSTNHFIFDVARMTRLGLPVSKVPFGAQLINAAPKTKPQILFINSYNRGFQWVDDIENGFQNTVGEHGERADITFDYLDALRYPSTYQQGRILDIMRSKYRQGSFSMVVAADQEAWNFVRNNRREFWGDVPLIFLGVTSLGKNNAELPERSTGVLEAYDLADGVKLVRTLSPLVRNLVVVADDSENGLQFRSLMKVVEPHFPELKFSYPSDLSMGALQEHLSLLNSDSAVFLLSFKRDRENQFFTEAESIELISEASKVPVYGVWDYYLGKGLLGGKLTSGYAQGQSAGELALKILNGTDPATLPVTKTSPNHYMFDYKQLSRFGIDAGLLPAGSTIINQPLTIMDFYEANKNIVRTLSMVFLLLLVVILALVIFILINNSRLKNNVIRESQLANETKSRFLATMSHEIRTPMNGIIGFIDLLSRTEMSERQQEFIREVRAASEVLLHIINNILDISKIESRKVELDHSLFCLQDVIDHAINMVSPWAMEKNLELGAQVDSKVPKHFIGDPIRLQQVLQNLINNAVKFTDQGSILVSVKTRNNPASIEFTVQDTGIGIKHEDIDRLFKPFNQLDSATNRRYEGSGLGLAISAELIRLMGGDISVQSEPGSGTCFSFFVNLLVAPRDAEISPPEFRPFGNTQLLGIEYAQAFKRLHVLVAEDNDTNRRIIGKFLDYYGIGYDAVNNGMDASSAFQARRYDCIFMDCQMPVLDGYESARRIRQVETAPQHTPIVAMTANAMIGDKDICLAAGMDFYLAKPVHFDDFVQILIRIVRTSQDGVPEAIPAPAKLPILVAEDNATNANLLRRILANKNYQVKIATNGNEVLELIAKEAFSMVLMDIQMPGMDGFETTARIRQDELGTGRHLAIIAMTGLAMDEDRQHCLDMGMDAVAVKPIRAADLYDLVQKYLG